MTDLFCYTSFLFLCDWTCKEEKNYEIEIDKLLLEKQKDHNSHIWTIIIIIIKHLGPLTIHCLIAGK